MLDFYIRVVKALDEVAKEAAHIGPETLGMWNKTLARAREEIVKGDAPRKW